MEMFKLNEKLKDYSCGAVDLDGALRELYLISDAGGKTYRDETEAIPATQFILERNKKDYLRVECHSNTEAHFSSDRLVYPSNWIKRIFSSPVMQFRTPLAGAEKVIANYFSYSREKFEDTYSASYSNRQSLMYIEVNE